MVSCGYDGVGGNFVKIYGVGKIFELYIVVYGFGNFVNLDVLMQQIIGVVFGFYFLW